MFSSYILYDTVAIEAVYFPRDFPSASTTASNSSATANTGSSNSNAASDDASAAYALTMRDILLHRLTERYVGRVIPSRGLCVAITEVLEYSASSVRGAAASAWLTATFGVCVFAPRPGTRLKARIAHQSAAGVHLTMDLLVSIPFLVPAELLVPGSLYSAAQGVWHLPVDAEGDADEGADGARGGRGAKAGEGAPASPAPLTGSAAGAETATAAAAACYNTYVAGAEVLVKVESCTVQSEEAVAASQEAGGDGLDGGSVGGGVAAFPGGGAGLEAGLPIMELQGSFLGDALGPVSWFEDEA